MAVIFFLICRFLLFQLFLYSSLSKILNYSEFSAKTPSAPFFQLKIAPSAVVLQELLIITLLCIDATVAWGGAYGALLLILYTLYLYKAPDRANGAACECFAINELVKIKLSKNSRLLINTGLVVLALIFSYAGFINNIQLSTAQSNMPWLTLGFKINLIGFSFIIALQVFFLDSYKGLKNEVAEIDRILINRGMKVKSGANLGKDLNGKLLIDKNFDEVPIEAILDAEKGGVVVYLKEGCTACKDILQRLPAYIETSKNKSKILFVYGGNPRAFLELCSESKLENLYLDKADNIRLPLRIFSFPSAFYINGEHQIFSDFAIAEHKIMELLDYLQQEHSNPWLNAT
jgi:hypothetical protein